MSTSLRACNFCSRSLISEERENQDKAGGPGAQSRYWSWAVGQTGGLAAREEYAVYSTFSEGSPTPSSPCKPVPKAGTPGSGMGLGVRPTSVSQAPAEGERCTPGASWPPYPRLHDPERIHHKEHHSSLIRLPLETGIPMQKACLLPDQTGERCHPPTPTDGLGREFVTRPGLCPFPGVTGTLHISPYWRSRWKQRGNSYVVRQRDDIPPSPTTAQSLPITES